MKLPSLDAAEMEEQNAGVGQRAVDGQVMEHADVAVVKTTDSAVMAMADSTSQGAVDNDLAPCSNCERSSLVHCR